MAYESKKGFWHTERLMLPVGAESKGEVPTQFQFLLQTLRNIFWGEHFISNVMKKIPLPPVIEIHQGGHATWESLNF